MTAWEPSSSFIRRALTSAIEAWLARPVSSSASTSRYTSGVRDTTEITPMGPSSPGSGAARTARMPAFWTKLVIPSVVSKRSSVV